MELQCYNKGCLKKFIEDENTDESCIYHPGPPFFHDAYKGWSCCNKKVTDFTEFLNIQGCTVGRHNPEKPPEPEKHKIDQSDREEIVEYEAPKPRIPATPAPRPSDDEPFKRLPITVAASLAQQLEKIALEQSSENMAPGSLAGDGQPGGIINDTINVDTAVRPGEICKNNGCGATYVDERTNKQVCCHHSGVPIFHEGMKYWSCCKKKTTEFDVFLSMPGCTKGSHVWKKEKSTQESVSCRYDWHQTGGSVVLTIYSKITIPTASYVDVNSVHLKAHMEFNKGGNVFDLDIPLWGVIDVSQCSVVMSGTKVEVKMKKADPVSWSTLIYTPPKEG